MGCQEKRRAADAQVIKVDDHPYADHVGFVGKELLIKF